MTAQTHLRAGPAPENDEEQTRSLLDMAFHAFVEQDSGGLITDWNAQAENVFGWTRAEALGQSFALLIASSRHRDFCKKSVREVFDSGLHSDESRKLEITAVHRYGRELSIELTLFCTARGEALRLGAFMRDLSPAKSREEEIEERRRFVVGQLAESYHEVNLIGSVTFISKNHHQHGGGLDASDLGVNYKQLFIPEEAAGLREHYSEVYRSGKPARIEYPRTHHGQTRFFDQSVSLCRDADGTPTGFAVVTRDCSERRRNEIAVADAKKSAEAASKAKSEFLASMSHEIRTPLHGVMGMLALASQTGLTSEQADLLKMAEDSASSLLVVINDILDFSRMEAGMLELDCATFAPADIVAEVVSGLGLRARQKGLELACTIAPDVPGALTGDSARLKQVLLNLLGNAIKFTDRGEVDLQVQRLGEKGLDPGKVQLQFSIADSGIGISSEQQALIFGAFSQADSSVTRKYGGTGLGLAICTRIVKLMGGDLRVESKINEGSVFYFTATFATPQEVNAGEEQSRGMCAPLQPAQGGHATGTCAMGPQPEERSRPLNILLAEDNVVNQKLAIGLLKGLGHEVTVARDGRDALQLWHTQSFDLVLMDVEMAGMNGCEASAAIRRQEEKTHLHIPIIATTAHDTRGERERCLKAGMDGFLSKPMDAGKLENTLRIATEPGRCSAPRTDSGSEARS